MTAVAETRLRGRTRWSYASRCPRMAAYGLLGAEPEEPSEHTRLLFARGKMDETWWIDNVLAPRVGHGNIVREKPVQWPAPLPVGELHPDAYVTTERKPYEIKSHASGDPMDSDYVQLCGAMHYDPDVDPKAGALVVIDRDLHWEAFPVILTDDRVEQVEQIAAKVVHAGRTGELPDRVCEKPSDARGHLCPFASRCFADWTPPDPEHLPGDAAVAAVELLRVQDDERVAKAALEEFTDRRRELQARLAEWELEPGVEYAGAGVRVKRTAVADVERVSLKTLREAGAWTPEIQERLGPFVTRGGAHDRWKVTPDRDATVTVDDFGDEAPF